MLIISLSTTKRTLWVARGDETTKPVNYDGRSTAPTVPVEGAFHKDRNFVKKNLIYLSINMKV